ncbi:MAG: methylmalonyl Co-A mutase-associated GTPase MeaB [Oscillospiraceae bacterium]
MADVYRPEWVPENAGEGFATQVMRGIHEDEITAAKAPKPVCRARELTARDYVDGILRGDRMILARAITIIESNAAKHAPLAHEIVQEILPFTGKSSRVGITGVPGAGKSTFIEALGCMLCDQGKKVAVLAVDPSSPISRGSVLGDKTRMEHLSRHPNAFIRPSPSAGRLGGVARKSRETILLCEAAGYDTILVETVGVGQGETTVRSMVDFFMVLVITGAGDELQGIKKGVIELADAILVNKADGNNLQNALNARAEYNQVLHYLRPVTEGWQPKAYTCSALTGQGIGDFWDVVTSFVEKMNETGQLQKRRREQEWEWVQELVWQHLQDKMKSNPRIDACLRDTHVKMDANEMSATVAAQTLIDAMETELQQRG